MAARTDAASAKRYPGQRPSLATAKNNTTTRLLPAASVPQLTPFVPDPNERAPAPPARTAAVTPGYEMIDVGPPRPKGKSEVQHARVE